MGYVRCKRGRRVRECKSALCREYGITRRTGDKWLERAQNGELLEDRSRAPKSSPNKTTPEVEELILETRDQHPYWGSRKLKCYLEDKGHEGLPCKTTFENILKRNDRIEPEASDIGKRLRKVNCKGYVSINEHRYYLAEALIGKYLSLHDEDDDKVVLCYGKFQVARIDLDQRLIISKRIYRSGQTAARE